MLTLSHPRPEPQMPLDPTKNQHYVSQAEQRLNAMDHESQTRIFALDVIDRDRHVLRPRNSDGSSIKNSLSFNDLFTMDVVSPSIRNNLEQLFQRYERDVASHSLALIRKLKDGDAAIKKEIVELFAAKLLNFLRNPFSIRKVLDTFGSVANCQFTDALISAEFDKAIVGTRPQRDQVCGRFGIDGNQYDQWLRVLFLLLTDTPRREFSLFEQFVKHLLESHRTRVYVAQEATADADRVFLLSDRGFNEFRTDLTSLGLGEASTFEFNLYSRACLSFTFIDPTPLITNGRLPAFFVDEKMRANVTVIHVINNRELLVSYNQRTISHCAKAVFSSRKCPVLK
jgi:hypothetical protein